LTEIGLEYTRRQRPGVDQTHRVAVVLEPERAVRVTALPQIVTDGEESGGVGYSDYKDAIVFYAIVLSWRTALQPRTLAADAHIREVTVARAA
jgi:hypothetical protein